VQIVAKAALLSRLRFHDANYFFTPRQYQQAKIIKENYGRKYRKEAMSNSLPLFSSNFARLIPLSSPFDFSALVFPEFFRS